MVTFSQDMFTVGPVLRPHIPIVLHSLISQSGVSDMGLAGSEVGGRVVLVGGCC